MKIRCWCTIPYFSLYFLPDSFIVEFSLYWLIFLRCQVFIRGTQESQGVEVANYRVKQEESAGIPCRKYRPLLSWPELLWLCGLYQRQLITDRERWKGNTWKSALIQHHVDSCWFILGQTNWIKYNPNINFFFFNFPH